MRDWGRCAANQHTVAAGCFDVAVEVCSLSKMYAMAGWRAGFIAGNDDIVSHVKQYHYQMGSMVTSSIQDAGTVALLSDQSCVAELAERYASRREIVAGGLREVGLDVFDSDGGIYAWVHAPEDQTGEQFATCCWNVRPSPRCRARVLAKWARITYDSACLNPRTSCVRLCAGWLLC